MCLLKNGRKTPFLVFCDLFLNFCKANKNYDYSVNFQKFCKFFFYMGLLKCTKGLSEGKIGWYFSYTFIRCKAMVKQRYICNTWIQIKYIKHKPTFLSFHFIVSHVGTCNASLHSVHARRHFTVYMQRGSVATVYEYLNFELSLAQFSPSLF